MSVQGALSRYGPHVERALAKAMPAEDAPPRLRDAMAYSLEGPGKRIRPVLCFAACEAAGGDPEGAESAATALELVHTYSLIHDDLPCMDDDDTRRGRPTNHVVYGEALAVLAGDALLTRAFEVVVSDLQLTPSTRAAMVAVLARAAGETGMVGGQVLDLEAEGRAVEPAELVDIHARKTGALFEASCRMGGLAAGSSDEATERLASFGRQVGLAFQIADDLLDETGSAESLGKAAGKDRERGKATYPVVFGVAESRRRLAEAAESAVAVLGPFGAGAEPLAALARFIVERSN